MENLAADNALLSNIKQALVARYRDLGNPWYGWVLPAYEAIPYKAVVNDFVTLGATVEDDTDLNDDVSCRYLIQRDGVLLIAELSLVGPYAVLLYGDDKDLGRAVSNTKMLTLVQDIKRLFELHRLVILGPAVLCTLVDMPFGNVQAKQGTIYQALISDTQTPDKATFVLGDLQN